MGRGQRKVPAHAVRKILGDNVARIMQDKVVSAVTVAKATGLGRRTVNRLVNGEVACQIDTIGAIADVLGVSPFELFVERSGGSASTTRKFTSLVRNGHTHAIDLTDLKSKTGRIGKVKSHKKG